MAALRGGTRQFIAKSRTSVSLGCRRSRRPGAQRLRSAADVGGDGVIDGLRRLIGAESVLADEPSRRAAGTDFITQRGLPAAVVRPRSSDEVAAVVGFPGQRGLGIGPPGSCTDLSGGLAPDGRSLVLDLS